MKRAAALLLILLLTLPLLPGCSSAFSGTPTGEEKAGEKTEEKKTGEKEETKVPDLSGFTPPAGFSVGYARVDISPDLPIHTYAGAIAHKLHDPLQMTCTAMSDGEGIFLLYNLDLRGIPNKMADYAAERLEKQFGIPAERVFLNCSHTHTSVDTTDEPDVLKWRSKVFFRQLPVAAALAIRDLSPARAYGGAAPMEEGVTFVRRYLLKDGTYRTNPGSDAVAVAHETEADREMRVIRFEREKGLDVVMVNYQTHYGSVSGLYPDSVSADWVHPFREETERELNCRFAYINGAGGNLNFQSAIPGERKYADFEKAIPSFVKTVKDCIAAETELATGPIRSTISVYEGRAWNGETREPTGIRELTFRAVTVGDMAFAGAPYEMFDMHGVQIRRQSPCKMTFISAYTGGRNSYVPHAEGYEHGSYEAEVSYFVPGSGEEFAGELLRMLNACKDQG